MERTAQGVADEAAALAVAEIVQPGNEVSVPLRFEAEGVTCGHGLFPPDPFAELQVAGDVGICRGRSQDSLTLEDREQIVAQQKRSAAGEEDPVQFPAVRPGGFHPADDLFRRVLEGGLPHQVDRHCFPGDHHLVGPDQGFHSLGGDLKAEVPVKLGGEVLEGVEDAQPREGGGTGVHELQTVNPGQVQGVVANVDDSDLTGGHPVFDQLAVVIENGVEVGPHGLGDYPDRLDREQDRFDDFARWAQEVGEVGTADGRQIAFLEALVMGDGKPGDQIDQFRAFSGEDGEGREQKNDPLLGDGPLRVDGVLGGGLLDGCLSDEPVLAIGGYGEPGGERGIFHSGGEDDRFELSDERGEVVMFPMG